MFIIKSFKSFVLKVRILKELWAEFAEVQILKDLVASEEWEVASTASTPVCDGKCAQALEEKGVATVPVCPVV